MQATSIEWTDYSANPFKFRDAEGKIVWGCVKHSAGCANCYSETLAKRYGRGGPFTKETMRGLTPFVDEKELRSMLTYKSARDKMCFVGDMTDVFGEWVTDDMLDKLFAVFAFRQDVTWQVLTKRPERMADYLLSFRNRKSMDRIDAAARTLGCAVQFTALDGRVLLNHDWPLKNVHLGTSVENQAAADERIPHLLRVPAAVRFLSCEPLLSEVQIDKGRRSWLGSFEGKAVATGEKKAMPGIDWVIVGGESGPGARPCDAEWIHSIVKQCRAASVPVFVKQLGAFIVDRNDIGFDATAETWAEGPDEGKPVDPRAWPDMPDIEEDLDGTRDGYQGAPVRVRLRDKKGGKPVEWPEALRVREFPTVKAEVPA